MNSIRELIFSIIFSPFSQLSLIAFYFHKIFKAFSILKFLISKELAFAIIHLRFVIDFKHVKTAIFDIIYKHFDNNQNQFIKSFSM